MDIKQHSPVHPGVFIKRVYITPNNIGSNQLARQLKVSTGIASRLLNGKIGVSSEMALKLSKVLGRSPESWLLMQGHYDLWKAQKIVDLSDYEPLKLP